MQRMHSTPMAKGLWLVIMQWCLKAGHAGQQHRLSKCGSAHAKNICAYEIACCFKFKLCEVQFILHPIKQKGMVYHVSSRRPCNPCALPMLMPRSEHHNDHKHYWVLLDGNDKKCDAPQTTKANLLQSSI